MNVGILPQLAYSVVSITLPGHIASALGLPSQADDASFTNCLYEFSGQCDGLLASNEIRDYARCQLIAAAPHLFESYPSFLKSAKPKYYLAYLDGKEWFSISVFPDHDFTALPASKVEEDIVAKWITDSAFDLSAWNKALKGSALIKWLEAPPAASSVEYPLVYELISAICEAAVEAKCSPFLKSTSIEISKRDIQGLSSIKLLGSALNEKNPKWRFLSLYRILENGYLGELLKKINTDFLADPDRTIADAQKTLKSEVVQFFEYVKSKAIESQFDDFNTRFEQLISDKNFLAHAIQRKIDGSADSTWKTGVLCAYKIRCAIAHAGVGDTYVELHADWKSCLEYLLPPLEEAALLSHGIKLV